jgi:hypothetical protein
VLPGVMVVVCWMSALMCVRVHVHARARVCVCVRVCARTCMLTLFDCVQEQVVCSYQGPCCHRLAPHECPTQRPPTAAPSPLTPCRRTTQDKARRQGPKALEKFEERLRKQQMKKQMKKSTVKMG